MRRLMTSLVVLGTLVGCKSAPVRPDEGANVETAQKPADAHAWRTEQPKAGEAPELVIPAFEQSALPNGLTVLVSRRAELPLVSLQLACAVGSSGDPAGKAGLASLAYQMLLEGAGTRDALAYDDAFADLGVSPSVGAGDDSGGLSVTVMTRNADAALGLLTDALLRPRLEQKSFDRRKSQQLANLARAEGNPRWGQQWAVSQAVFGAKHPYGHLSSGTPPSVRALTLADTRRFVSQQLGPKACALIAAGDVTLAEAEALAQKHLGKWKGTATRGPIPATPEATPRTAVNFVPKAGLNQTLIAVARPGLTAGDEREAALDLATSVFGGFFGSRLNMNLREEKGYTYGAFANASARRGPGLVMAGSSVRADVTGPALEELMKEMAGMKTRPITPEELSQAREGLVRALPGGFERVESLAGTAASLFAQGLPLDHLNRWIERVEKADATQVQLASDAFLKPELMQLVVVGDPEVVKTQIVPLNLGTLETHELPR